LQIIYNERNEKYESKEYVGSVMAANDSRDERIYSLQLDAKYFQPDFRRLETCTQVATVTA
jgi:hypothetical protein